VPLFGLPGNPVSCMVNFYEFVRPYLRTSLGDPTPFLPMVDATTTHDFRGKSGRVRLERVLLQVSADGWLASSTGSQSSGVLTSMALAHGLMVVGIDEPSPKAGAKVRVQLLDPSFLAGANLNR
jgi:molybdopterin molybdotransferase